MTNYEKNIITYRIDAINKNYFFKSIIIIIKIMINIKISFRIKVSESSICYVMLLRS